MKKKILTLAIVATFFIAAPAQANATEKPWYEILIDWFDTHIPTYRCYNYEGTKICGKAH